MRRHIVTLVEPLLPLRLGDTPLLVCRVDEAGFACPFGRAGLVLVVSDVLDVEAERLASMTHRESKGQGWRLTCDHGPGSLELSAFILIALVGSLAELTATYRQDTVQMSATFRTYIEPTYQLTKKSWPIPNLAATAINVSLSRFIRHSIDRW